MSAASGRVIVVGGGVIGAACAYYLSKTGWSVQVIDQGEFGMGCSHGNCGFICPSHVLPLAEPGAVGRALRSMLHRDSAVYIKPRFDPALWSWLWRFARRCNLRDMMAAGRAIHALLRSSRSLYDHLMRDEPFDCEWQTKGVLFVLRTSQGMEHFARTVELLRDSFQVPTESFDGGALVKLEPALKPGLAGGWWFPSDAHLRPDRLMASWKRVLQSRGVIVQERCALQRFLGERGRAIAALTTQGQLAADAFVLAAGALTRLLDRGLGCRLPIQPGKGYSITMPRPAQCPERPIIFEEHRVAVTPMQSGYRLGSTMEFAGYDATLNRRRLDLLRRAARHYLREPETEPVQEEWFGWRPMTPDGVPVISRSPALENVVIAAGHNMLGVAMSPATGKLVAEMLSGGPTHIDPAPYAASRFADCHEAGIMTVAPHRFARGSVHA
jgi:D-amino-acid dehydrogenase